MCTPLHTFAPLFSPGNGIRNEREEAMKKAGLVALAAAIFACALPPETWADGERGTKSEEADYARREAATPGLAEFRGGCGGPDGAMLVILILTLPITLPIFGLWKLGEWGVSLLTPPPAPKKDHPPTPTEPRRPGDPGTIPTSAAPSVSCPSLG